MGEDVAGVPGFTVMRTASKVDVSRGEAGPAHADGEPFDAPKDFSVSLLTGALSVWA
jgi:hypothetical protein